jgi:hypothetical protein
MKTLITLAGIMFALVCVEPAIGQWQTVAEMKVPFSFVMGDTALPAGTYAVRLDSQTQTLSLLNRDEPLSAISIVHNIALPSSALAESTRLVFDFDGQRRVLHQVVGGDNHMHDLIHGTEIAELAGTPST